MLEFSTAIKTISVKVNNKVYKVPVTLTMEDLMDVTDGDLTRAGDVAQSYALLSKFFEKYIPNFKKLPSNNCVELMNEWTKANRAELGES